MDIPKFSKYYDRQILHHFTQDIPNQVTETHNAIPMELCMATLAITTLSATSVQRAVEIAARERDYFIIDPTDFDLQYGGMPHPNDIRRTLIAWPRKQISSRYRKINHHLIKKLKKSIFFKKMHGKKGITAAFDITEVGYYGSEDEFTMWTKGRSAAKRCHAYLSLQIVCPGFRMILDVKPIFQKSKTLGKLMADMLKRMRRFGLKFQHIYLDRGFYQIEVLRELREHHSGSLLMPVIRSSRVKSAIAEWHQEHGFKAGILEMALGNKSNEEKYFLIFSPLSKKERANLRRKKKDAGIHEFYLYFCLLKPPEVSQESINEVFQRLSYNYRGRWGIETGYRVVKSIWAMTTSTHYTLRLWLMWNSILMYNLWVMNNLEALEKKGIPDDYSCCEEVVPLDKIEETELKRKAEKYPKWARSSKEKPVRDWKPRSLIKLNHFRDLLMMMSRKHISDILTTGYDPPFNDEEVIEN